MDDFEFKPLTEGLGFHRKKVSTSTAVPPAAPTVKPAAALLKGNLPADMDLVEPLPRKNLERPQIPTAPESSRTVDRIIQTLHQKQKRSAQFDLFPNAEPLYTQSVWQFSAGLLDAMLVLSATLLGLIILLVSTHVDLFGILFSPHVDPMVYVSLIAMVAGFSWIYLVGNRIFLGFTPGEWVFDQRLSKPNQVGTNSYCLRVALRSTLVILTGFVVFPALSQLLGKDLAGEWTGVELLKKAS